MDDDTGAPARPLYYRRGNWFGRHLMNGAVAGLTRLGFSVWGSRLLRVRGRKSGRPFTTPVNLLTIEGQRYLVAPRGHTQWVRNLRAAGSGELLLGPAVDSFTATEVAEEQRPPILRAYLRRWRFEAGAFFAGVGPEASDRELARIAQDHPVFRLSP
jgi:deazaflavin-dependent oxidoreductase (nitroreductase family)